MSGNDEQRETQQTQPKGIDPKTGKPYYEPIDIPVPKRSVFNALLRRAEITPPGADNH